MGRRMVTLLTGLMAMPMAVAFLDTYAVKLNTPPFWIIVAAVLVLAIQDFVLSLRNVDNDAMG